MAAADTVYVQPNTETRLHSETADNILWEKYAGGGTTKHAQTMALTTRIGTWARGQRRGRRLLPR